MQGRASRPAGLTVPAFIILRRNPKYSNELHSHEIEAYRVKKKYPDLIINLYDSSGCNMDKSQTTNGQPKKFKPTRAQRKKLIALQKLFDKARNKTKAKSGEGIKIKRPYPPGVRDRTRVTS